VDDEEPVLDSYEFMLKISNEGRDSAFTLAGKARSGYEALQLIHELEPDLVFMDINIPGLDGLEVIADVHNKFPAMIIVLSTAYERFDLARRAIPLGVFAYLVKPVSKKTFLETLDTVQKALQSRGGTAPAEAENPRQCFFRRTVWKGMSQAQWESCREELSLPSDKGIVFFLELDREPEKWCALAAEKISYKHYCIYDVLLNRGLFLVSEDISREVLRDRLEAVFEETVSGKAGYFWGLGELCRGPELHLSCARALRELEDKRKETDIQQRERLRIIQLRRKTENAAAEEAKQLLPCSGKSCSPSTISPWLRRRWFPYLCFL
jgi:two-component system response regulator YesN